ncbi:MAG: hypothetical protein LUG51_03220 [Tannerellaceae bacterium]|nr:hypothetical protein [Tannerellaceae bacterium]
MSQKKLITYRGIYKRCIKRHKFDEFIVSLSVRLYVDSGCGFRSVVKILSLLNDLLDWRLSNLPCANTISGWVQKSGYKIYKTPVKGSHEANYALILDESMMVGSERLLLTLKTPAQALQHRPLSWQDVQVVNMSVKERWDAKSIALSLEKTIKLVGKPPAYIISDNDTKLKKAIHLLDLPRIADVGHTLALCLENTYKKEADFKEYMKKLSDLRFKALMTPAYYLLPPSQRTIARFMNLNSVIKWSERMLVSVDKLGQEKETFLFVKEYASLIDELSESFSVVEFINTTLKQQGFNQQRQKMLNRYVSKTLFSGNTRQQVLALRIKDYLAQQGQKIKLPDKNLYVSSDLVESFFSVYKKRKAPNPLYGVTPFILLLPLLTQKSRYKQSEYKEALEGVFLSDIKRWRKDNLSENKASKRTKSLAT